MAKKAKALTAEELTKIQGLVNAMNQGQSQIGGIEMQKQELMNQLTAVNNELQKTQAELREKYGDVNISLADGTLSEAEDAGNS